MKYSVGKTLEDKAIWVDDKVAEGATLSAYFWQFSENDVVDAILALEYLALSERRRPVIDARWLEAIDLTHLYILSLSTATRVARLWTRAHPSALSLFVNRS